ncbi:unnamed protein product [Mytilus edulis]|uniref:B box-type domain-containing protein n=1 Tax=Mytilus edulis TaxID=6550 RepID=A0A8S3Q5S3_MYTED|nr:unnamed protein product [Mytilus edulis]
MIGFNFSSDIYLNQQVMASSKPSQAIKPECDKHGQDLILYCPGHLMPCCDECISTSHSKCTGIKSLAGVVEKTKIENSKESVETNINSILNLLGTLINNKSKNIKRGENQYKDIQKSIKEIRKEINNHLDHLEKKLSQEIDTIWNQEKASATDFISEIEGEKKNLKEIKEHLQTVTRNTSKLQSFLGVHQIEQQVHQCQRYVEDLNDDERTKEVDIKMKQNDEIEKIQNTLESLESLGEVIVIKTETAMKIEISVGRELKVPLQEQSNINNMTMNIETKIEINIKKWISDMICLMDGRVIVVEEDGKVNLLTSDGKLQKQLPIPGKAYSVTQINQNTIAITYPWERAIKIFNMENETVTKVITLDNACGVYHSSIILWLVIYSDYNGNAVYCVDESGKQIWQYTQDLSGPRGLCTDTYGNIIVADYNSHRIIVISKDGQESKVLISKEDGLKNP